MAPKAKKRATRRGSSGTVKNGFHVCYRGHAGTNCYANDGARSIDRAVDLAKRRLLKLGPVSQKRLLKRGTVSRKICVYTTNDEGVVELARGPQRCFVLKSRLVEEKRAKRGAKKKKRS